jgi:hypothetical protein
MIVRFAGTECAAKEASIVKLKLAGVLVALFFCMAPAWAQAGNDELVAGSHGFEVWTGLGHSISKSVTHTAVWNGGVRYGWVLTDPHGPGFLRGRFEYGVDAVPVFVVFQPARTAYGVSLDPFALRWNFQERRRIMPYVEFSGGVLFTNHQVPPGASAINFTPSAGVGISVPHGRFRWNAELHYLHISDAFLTSYNPGINLLQLRVGIALYKRPK